MFVWCLLAVCCVHVVDFFVSQKICPAAHAVLVLALALVASLCNVCVDVGGSVVLLEVGHADLDAKPADSPADEV